MPEKQRIRNLVVLLMGILVAAAAWITWKSWQISSPKKEGPGMPGILLKNIQYTKTSHGRAVWTLQADKAEHEQATGITRAEHITLVFHDKESGDIVLTADQGKVFSANETIMVSGHVRIEKRPDNTLLTERLFYDEKTGILSTDAPVMAILENSTIRGKGLLIDTRKRTLEILYDVNATLDQEGSSKEDS